AHRIDQRVGARGHGVGVGGDLVRRRAGDAAAVLERLRVFAQQRERRGELRARVTQGAHGVAAGGGRDRRGDGCCDGGGGAHDAVERKRNDGGGATAGVEVRARQRGVGCGVDHRFLRRAGESACETALRGDGVLAVNRRVRDRTALLHNYNYVKLSW